MTKPVFVRWTDWINEADIVIYGERQWPSYCRWFIPGTGEMRWL